MLRPAIIYKEKNIFVEFTPAKFVKLLKQYFNKTKDIEKAIEQIIEDLKEETKRV
jgi:hypothetical protein